MKPALAIALVAAHVAAGQSIPPAGFGLPTAQNNTKLSVAFFPNNLNVVVEPGMLFGKQITSTQPSIAINGKASATLARVADDGTQFLLVMIDPDAPTPDAPTASAILHWMAPNLAAKTAPQDVGPLQGQSVLANATPNAAPYLPPGPPPTSSAHRYLLFLFAQPAPGPFAVPPAFAQFAAGGRARFDLNAFVAAAGLAPPLAVNFMYVSSQPAVDPAFQGAPFGTFPGGNGNAVGLPGSTAGGGGGAAGNGTGAAAPTNGTAGAAPPAGGAGGAGGGASSGSPPPGGSTPGGAGMTTRGTGVISAADGSCVCNVECAPGSLPRAVAV